MIEQELKAGTPLSTLDGTRFSNGVVVSVDGTHVWVLTDFGNQVKLSIESLETYFTVPDWYKDEMLVNEQLGVEGVTLLERVDTQITLLTAFREQLLMNQKLF